MLGKGRERVDEVRYGLDRSGPGTKVAGEDAPDDPFERLLADSAVARLRRLGFEGSGCFDGTGGPMASLFDARFCGCWPNRRGSGAAEESENVLCSKGRSTARVSEVVPALDFGALHLTGDWSVS